MKRRGFVAQRLECVLAACKGLAGAFASSGDGCQRCVGACPDKAGASSTHSKRFARLGCVSFLLSLLSLAPLAQAQTNRPSGTVVSWGQWVLPYVEPGTRFTAIAAGGDYTLALKSDGSVVAWGDNTFGQTDVPVEAQSGVVAIAAGGAHSVALKSDGSVLAWGDNGSGQTDVPLAAQSGVVAIAAGDFVTGTWRGHTVALKSDGSVVAWGDNKFGQTDVPVEAQSGVVAIAAGKLAHILALKSDGSVVAWGYNGFGETTVPVAAKSGVVAIAAGMFHSVALKSDGSVVAWGNSSDGRTTVPAAAKSGVVAIGAGYHHTLAVKTNGSVLAWGWNEHGQTTVPVGLPPAFAIAGSYGYTLALVRDPAPLLTLLRNVDQTLSLSWSGAGALEVTEGLATPNWQPAPNQANPQTLSTTGAMKFFRVKAD